MKYMMSLSDDPFPSTKDDTANPWARNVMSSGPMAHDLSCHPQRDEMSISSLAILHIEYIEHQA